MGVGIALLALLIIRFVRLGHPPRTELLVLGGALAYGGIVSQIIRPFLYRTAPDIDEELKSIFGYGLPMRFRVPLLIIMAVVGVGIIGWALFSS